MTQKQILKQLEELKSSAKKQITKKALGIAIRHTIVRWKKIKLDKEIKLFLKEGGAPFYWCGDAEQMEWCAIIARHFYDLGCRHTAAIFDDIEHARQKASHE